jgi:hypothetical protein
MDVGLNAEVMIVDQSISPLEDALQGGENGAPFAKVAESCAKALLFADDLDFWIAWVERQMGKVVKKKDEKEEMKMEVD